MPRPSAPAPGDKPATPSAGCKPRPGKLFRRFRRTVRALFILGMLVPVVAVVLTQGPVPRWLVARSVRKATGAEFDASWVSLKLDGRFIATDARLTAPASSGLTGDAARIAEAERIEVVLDWSAWAAGVVAPQSVRVVKPVVRLSLDRGSNELNVSRLKTSSGTSSISKVPRIEVDHGRLILAEHGAPPPGSTAPSESAYKELTRLETAGWISPVFGTKRYLVHLSATNPDDERMKFDLTGGVDLETSRAEVKLTPIDLATLTGDRLPTATRAVWDELHLRGKVAGTTIRYTPETGFDTTVSLDDVSLNAPIASGRAEITGSRTPRMESVAGTLRLVWAGPAQGLHADLRGLFEDLPARVRMDSRALSLDAAYSAVILADRFQLEKDPRILWFTPEVVQKNFEMFSGPTAVIDARIEVTRKPPVEPGVPGETAIAGTMVFENGSAAYGIFPYPMTEMSGTIRFDEEGVQIIGVQGRGPTGARLFGEGTVDTATPEGAYDIRVTATDVPIDQTLKAALLASPGGPMVGAVFSQSRLDELVAKGLVRSPRSGQVAAAEGAPPFDVLSGMVDSIQIHVKAWGRPNDEPVIHQDISVRFKDVHALPALFPYPLSGSDVALRIGDDFVEVHGEGLTGLYGGTASLQARVDVLPAAPGLKESDRYRPTIHLKAQNFPIEPVLINALPDAEALGAVPAAGAFSVKSFLTQLHLNGPVDGDIRVTPAPDPADPPAIDTQIVFEGVTAQPDHAATSTGEPLVLEGLVGAMRAGDKGVFIDALEGRLLRPVSAEPRPEELEGPPVAAKFRVDGEWGFSQGAAPAHADIQLSARDLDVSLAVEDLLRPLSPAAAKQIESLRAERKPAGRTDLAVQLNSLPPEKPGLLVAAQITNGRNVSLAVGDERVELVQDAGSLGVRTEVLDKPDAQPDLRITLDGLAGLLKVNGETIASVTATGEVTPPGEGEGAGATPLLVHQPVDVLMRGVRLESSVTRQLASRFGGAAVSDVITPYQPEGVVDADVRLSLPIGERDPAKWEPMIALRPRWLAITRDAGGKPQRLKFPLISGEVRLDPAGGTFDELSVVEDDWFARFNGRWTRGGGVSAPAAADGKVTGEVGGTGAAWSLLGSLDVESHGLPASLLEVLPASIGSGMADARVQLLDDLNVPGTTVHIWADREGAAPSFSIKGAAQFSSLFADPGVAIDDASGTLGFSAARSGDGPTRSQLVLSEGAMRITGLRVTDAVGEISLPGDGSATVPSLQGEAYGGRLLMTAQTTPKVVETGASSVVEYHGSLQLAGVRFADLLRDIERSKPVGGGPVPPIGVVAESPAPPVSDGSRGLVEAQLSIEGVSGDPASRRGRGEVRIAGGQAVLETPGITPLISLAALQLPVASPFDFAHADVHVMGGTLYFDSLAILSDSLVLLGAGTMQIDNEELDLRMAARGRTKLPLITDLLDSFRDELMTARIRGTPSRPAFSLENFGAVRAAFKGKPNPLAEALRTDLDRLERDRQRTLRVSTGPSAEHRVVPLASPQKTGASDPANP